MNNVFKTTLLLTGMTALFILIGDLLGGRSGMMTAFIIAVVMNFGSYWFSDKIVLAMYRARQVDQYEAPELHAMIARLCKRGNLPMPKVYIIPDPQPNAFATGRGPNHAAVAVTEGILRLLSMEELEGVVAHELAHVKHRDILISSVAATIAGAIMMISRMAMWFGGGRSRDDRDANPIVLLLVMILAPVAAWFIQMWISRTREYAADAGGATLSGNPMGLANALRKLEAGTQRIPMDANPATSHMFIVNPLTGPNMKSLFSTHPSTEDRIAKLEAMAHDRDLQSGDRDFRRFIS
jgi:heat shock protein HtpX